MYYRVGCVVVSLSYGYSQLPFTDGLAGHTHLGGQLLLGQLALPAVVGNLFVQLHAGYLLYYGPSLAEKAVAVHQGGLELFATAGCEGLSGA